MEVVELVTLVVLGILGGAINAVAGGGATLIYPALLWVGLSPVNAVATIGITVLPGLFGSVIGQRNELRQAPREFLLFIIPTVFGAVLGAYGLYSIDPALFEYMVPWLMLSALILLIAQTKIHHAIIRDNHKISTNKNIGTFALALSALIIAIYGGFFGIGLGLLMLAMFGLSSRLKDAHQLNAVKNLYVMFVGVSAIVVFFSTGLINLEYGLVIAFGNGIGGYFTARNARNIPSKVVHLVSVLIAFAVTVYLFVR